MKNLFTICLFLLTPFLSQAKDVVVTIPDDIVSYDEITVNFDQSVTIINPKVFAAGEYINIAPVKYGSISASSITCRLFGFSEADSKSTNLQNGTLTEHIAHLGFEEKKGVFLEKIYQYSNLYTCIETVTCRPK